MFLETRMLLFSCLIVKQLYPRNDTVKWLKYWAQDRCLWSNLPKTLKRTMSTTVANESTSKILWREGTDYDRRMQRLHSCRIFRRWFIRVNQIPNAITLFLCHVFAMYQRCSISASFKWFRFSKRMVVHLFLSVGARAQVSFFLPHFNVIRTKEAEMQPLYIQ